VAIPTTISIIARTYLRRIFSTCWDSISSYRLSAAGPPSVTVRSLSVRSGRPRVWLLAEPSRARAPRHRARLRPYGAPWQVRPQQK
jgi:hypothetical protein